MVKGEEFFAIFVLNFSVVPRKWRGWSFMEAMGEYQQ